MQRSTEPATDAVAHVCSELQAVVEGDIDRALTHFDTDCVVVDMNDTANPALGWAGVREYLEHVYAAVSDLEIDVTGTIAHGDGVAAEMVISGRHTGELAGIPASGRRLTYHACVCYRLEGGLIAEERVYYDVAEMTQGLAASDPVVSKRRDPRP